MKNKVWPLAEATEVAEELITLLHPVCERIAVAGSIRRQKGQVHDIELLAVPKEAVNTSLWLERPPLDARIHALIATGILDYRLNRKGSRTFGPLNKHLVHVPSEIGVDLFSTTTENFGMSWVVRTGPAEFCVRLMSRFKALGMAGHAYGGVTDQQGKEISCPTEEDVFRLAGWQYRPPEERG